MVILNPQFSILIVHFISVHFINTCTYLPKPYNYEKQERTLEIRHSVGSSDFDSHRHLAWRHLLHVHVLTIDFVEVDAIQVS